METAYADQRDPNMTAYSASSRLPELLGLLFLENTAAAAQLSLKDRCGR
jgi:hypothetical protein